ncbi:unnamed protein product [Nezara viridula]|uniref:Mitochondrial inner membrane protein Mpv17 n=1 Tax=Nezara viridula TaxID=85310 RepID=A0A9P0EEQ8_NEZVI|nr:unnamed protein product [Nezara viridula]
MALSRRIWLAGARFVGLRFRENPGLLPRPPVLVTIQSQPVFRNLFYKSPGSTMEALRIWKLMEYLGMDYCSIVRIRRRMKKYSYPWLTYCIPAALILALGDFIGQYHLKPHAADRTFMKFLTDEWNIRETLLFALMGFFPVGFLLSKWNLFLYRKLKCHGKLSFLVTKLLLDLFILTPILLSLMILVYGAFYDRNLINESSEEVKKTFKEKYWPALKQSMIFNLETRPLAIFAIFYLAPIHLRRLLKTVYEVIFATYVTSSIRENVQGPSGSSLSSGSPGSAKNLSTASGVLRSGSDSGLKASQTVGSSKGGTLDGGSPDSLVEEPLGRWARYKRWACRNRGD